MSSVVEVEKELYERDIPRPLIRLVQEYTYNEVDVKAAFLSSCSLGDLEVISRLNALYNFASLTNGQPVIKVGLLPGLTNACLSRRPNVVTWLVSRIAPDVKDLLGSSVLHLTCMAGNLDEVKILTPLYSLSNVPEAMRGTTSHTLRCSVQNTFLQVIKVTSRCDIAEWLWHSFRSMMSVSLPKVVLKDACAMDNLNVAVHLVTKEMITNASVVSSAISDSRVSSNLTIAWLLFRFPAAAGPDRTGPDRREGPDRGEGGRRAVVAAFT